MKKRKSNYGQGKYCKSYCVDCGKELKGYERCRKCYFKLIKEYPEKNGRYIDGRTHTQFYCKICKKKITYQTFFYGSKMCRLCSSLKNNKIQRHHINCDKKDNKKSNLIVLTNSNHHKAHWSVSKLIKELMERRIICFDRKKLIYKIIKRGRPKKETK